MIRLGNLILPSDLLIENEFGQPFVLADVETSINGEEIVFLQQNQAGMAFDLVATEESGWLTREMVEELKNMASQIADYELEYNGRFYRVRFRHEDPPVLELTPINPTPDAPEVEKYIGRIKLKEA